MEDWQDRIAIDPDVMGGKPVIKGTKIPLQTIAAYLAEGNTIEALCEQFELREEDVRAALAYATDMLDEDWRYLRIRSPELKERVSIDPKVMGGRPLIKGRRVPVAVIVGCLAGGDDVATVCREYRLEEAQVNAALAFAAAMLAEEQAHALPSR